MIPPKTFGAIASPLIELLEQDHHGIQLSVDEMDRLITWIDLNTNYYGSYALTRPYAPLGRCVISNTKPLWDVLEKPCAKCHRTGFHWGTVNGEYDTQYSVLLNLTHPEQSRLLRTALAKDAGGLELCKETVFDTADHPRYQAALRVIQGWSQELRENPREDMPGAKPAPEYDVWQKMRERSDQIESSSRTELANKL